KYFAHELGKRCASNSLEKLAGTLVDAQVDLNPHQVEAALFAFKSPLSKGAILADEVGLGKTIEAGILLSQKWAERKRKVLIIVPSSLRKQWNRELLEKFFLPSEILEARSFNQAIKQGKANPFNQDALVICSYQFAANKADYLTQIPWDLVVIDEAHRLRNVYKKQNKTARILREALASTPKVLLTATPLQNSLMELYGLVSFIDEYTFGDQKSFRERYARLTTNDTFMELKNRLAPICQRTLRRQVLEYVKYTNRVPITQEFTPTKDEEVLYEMVSEYLRRDNLQALPPSQRSLMTLVMRKLLASSTYAIAGALDSLSRKLKSKLKDDDRLKLALKTREELADDFELLEQFEDEWPEDLDEEEALTEANIEVIQSEIADLEAFRNLAVSITENAKGLSLMQALDAGFAKARSLDAAEKAIIFTESRRTQDYLLRILEESRFANQVVLFNGSNTDLKSREIYAAWKERHAGSDKVTGSRTADMRSALVDYFRDEAKIMIATEAAAEGVNLQFCSLVVNFDLPWNPQRIEQRIGRCHRYGQKHDVVVVNFLNKSNAADQRVYQLLDEKFQLFSGVFGASDEVLGSIESGIDFEKRISGIYQHCRAPDEIQMEFNLLREELDEQINEAMDQTRQQLLENFDSEVHEKLKVNLQASKDYLNRYESLLWQLTQISLGDAALFDAKSSTFDLLNNPYPEETIPLGRYKLGPATDDAHIYRLGHPLAQQIIDRALHTELPCAHLTFDYTNCPLQVSILKDLVGKSGHLSLSSLTIESAETQDHLIWAARTDDGIVLDLEQCTRLFSIPASIDPSATTPVDLTDLTESASQAILAQIAEQNANYFDEEMDKLERWADDQKRSLEIQIKDLDVEIKTLKTESRKLAKLEDKVSAQRQIKQLEQKRSDFRKKLFDAQDAIDQNKDGLLDDVEQRLQQTTFTNTLFSIHFSVV
ncbi:MAG: SNF2-related protein, partial [Verrucomicrobiales bacterium]